MGSAAVFVEGTLVKIEPRTMLTKNFFTYLLMSYSVLIKIGFTVESPKASFTLIPSGILMYSRYMFL